MIWARWSVPANVKRNLTAILGPLMVHFYHLLFMSSLSWFCILWNSNLYLGWRFICFTEAYFYDYNWLIASLPLTYCSNEKWLRIGCQHPPPFSILYNFCSVLLLELLQEINAGWREEVLPGLSILSLQMLCREEQSALKGQWWFI